MCFPDPKSCGKLPAGNLGAGGRDDLIQRRLPSAGLLTASWIHRSARRMPTIPALYLREPHDRAVRDIRPLDLGCATISRGSRRDPRSGATDRTGRPGTGSPPGSCSARRRWSTSAGACLPSTASPTPTHQRCARAATLRGRPADVARAMIEPLAGAYAFAASAADRTTAFSFRGAAYRLRNLRRCVLTGERR